MQELQFVTDLKHAPFVHWLSAFLSDWPVAYSQPSDIKFNWTDGRLHPIVFNRWKFDVYDQNTQHLLSWKQLGGKTVSFLKRKRN